jgi:hypothetical protein
MVKRMVRSKVASVARYHAMRAHSAYGEIWALEMNGKLHDPDALSKLRAPDTVQQETVWGMMTERKVPFLP